MGVGDTFGWPPAFVEQCKAERFNIRARKAPEFKIIRENANA